MGNDYSYLREEMKEMRLKHAAAMAEVRKEHRHEIEELLKKNNQAVAKTVKDITAETKKEYKKEIDKLKRDRDEAIKRLQTDKDASEKQKRELKAVIDNITAQLNSPEFVNTCQKNIFEDMLQKLEDRYQETEVHRHMRTHLGTVKAACVGNVNSGKSTLQNSVHGRIVCDTAGGRCTTAIKNTGRLVFKRRRNQAQLNVITYDVPGHEHSDEAVTSAFNYFNPETIDAISTMDMFIVIVDDKFSQIFKFVRIVRAMKKKIIFVRAKADTSKEDTHGIDVVRQADIQELARLGFRDPCYFCVSAHNQKNMFWCEGERQKDLCLYDWKEFIQCIEDTGYSLLGWISSAECDASEPVEPTHIHGFSDPRPEARPITDAVDAIFATDSSEEEPEDDDGDGDDGEDDDDVDDGDGFEIVDRPCHKQVYTQHLEQAQGSEPQNPPSYDECRESNEGSEPESDD
jgi:small GTP-binding protein